MKVHRLSTRGLILLCLLALQLQIFASSAIACKHARMADEAGVPSCPFHLAGSTLQDFDGSAGMFDCQKCVLVVLFGVYHAVAPSFAVTVVGTSPIEAATNLTHFYHFVPDRLHRPPISLLG